MHRNQAQLARMQAGHGLIPNAAEELLRYDSPVRLTGRHAHEDNEVLGKKIAAGEHIITLLGAANRYPPRSAAIRRRWMPAGQGAAPSALAAASTIA